jgi:hypothetical protein
MPISQDLRAAWNMDFAPTLNTYYFGDSGTRMSGKLKIDRR